MSVNRRLLAVLALVAALAALVVSTPAGATDETTKCTAGAVLKGENENPPSGSKAVGAILVHVNDTKLSFALAIANPARETFTRGHIHVGAADVNGPVLVTLFEGSTDRKLILQAARLDITSDIAARICADPGGFYVNYHTTDFPGGAIRGQLVSG
ncbi:MAG TPA: CHRD domain-containing protein [Gaiellaceae bacterium]|nr:CHRD domain-containing protein [Gaiellaceae bacterium]HXV95759.1 CHRD domain-containing protein [Gaiellaceae bacterium]